MKCLFTLLFSKFFYLIVTTGMVLGQSSSNVIFIDEKSPDHISIGKKALVFYDSDGTINIQALLKGDSLRFHEAGSEFGKDFEFPAVVWSKINITNRKSENDHRLILLCDLADSIQAFHLENGKILAESKSGTYIRPLNKEIPSNKNFIQLNLEPDQEKTIYIRSVFNKPVANIHYSHLYLRHAQKELSTMVFQMGVQSFYFGIMMILSLLGFILFKVFRESSFFYFGLLGLVFSSYFLLFSNAFDILIYPISPEFHVWIVMGSIFGLIILGFLLISRQISMKLLYPKIYKVFRFWTFFIVGSRLILHFIMGDVFFISFINNILLAIWIIIAMIPVIHLSWKRDPNGIQMLLGLGILFSSFIVLILGLMGLIPRNTWVLMSVQIGSVLFYSLLFVGMIEKLKTIQKEKLELSTINELKSRFFANISHEFRTPLTMIMGPITNLLQSSNQSEKNKKLLSTAKQQSGKLLEMVNDLLELSKLDSKNVKLLVEKKNIVSFVKGVAMSFDSLSEIKNIHLEVIGPNEIVPMWFDPAKMEIIITNLLFNSFKFTSEGGSITVEIKSNKNHLTIIISDTGSGISANKIPYIFDRFFQAEDNPIGDISGSGIGLSLVKEYINLHQGSIVVASEIGRGSCFTLTFLLGGDHLNSKHILIKEDVQTKSPEFDFSPNRNLHDQISDYNFEQNTVKINKNKATILIVEDNSDVRLFLLDQFVHDFNVVVAENGKKGIEMAHLHQPELIITDAMMPEVDGFELCKSLKGDLNTSHIPIIMLTARTEEEERIKGLEFGADDYITKPFNSRELKVRAKKLIEIRVNLKKNLLENPSLHYQSSELNQMDKDFLEKIESYIYKNISDPNFGVPALAKSVMMNQAQLNRKLKSLTELTASKYIQHLKLNRALLMLQQKEGNVSEVAFETGFSSNAYFIKCFKEKFGTTPGALIE
ncbi:MAG: response regulator [Saprospirales bacterium]|nr:MAG: response regulator [Saprospirales bacterium]